MKLQGSSYTYSHGMERRHDHRRKVDSVVYLTIEPNNGGVLLNLSEGGMCISVANPLARSSAQIHFSLALGANQPIEGTGEVSWVSESGRSAGVRFLFFSDESRRQIREWLETTGAPVSRVSPKRAIPAEKPASSAQAPAQSSAGAPAEASHPQNPEESHAVPQTPLFFLPKTPEADEIPPDEPGQQIYTWQEASTAENDGETVVAYRSALASTTEPEEEEEEEDRQSNKILIVATICFAFLAVVAAAVVAYPNRFSQLRQLAGSLMSPPAAASDTPAMRSMAHRVRRLRAKTRTMTPSGPLRGAHPVRDVTTFEAPRQGETSVTMEMTDPSRRRWRVTSSGSRLTRDEEPFSTSSAAPPPIPLSSGKGSAANAAKPPTSARMGNLRVDGGLLEEGSVTPTYAPLNLDGQALTSKPIVVEAVIGEDGRVKHARLVSSPSSSLAEAIVEAVKLWRYRPLYRNGKPIEFITRITVDFEGSAPEQ